MHTLEKPRKTGIYLRLSRDIHGDELAVARQKADCIAACQKLGLPYELYIDNDRSATSGVRREDWERLLAAIKSGDIEAVMVWQQDRLFRDPGDGEKFKNHAEPRGVPLLTPSSRRDLAEPIDLYMMRMEGINSALEIDKMKKRQRAAFTQRAELGRAFWPKRPFGFERPKRDGTGVMHRESEAALIRQAYTDTLRGRALKEIAREWNAAGVTTPTHANEDGEITSGGNQWTGMAMRALLLNGRNAGLRERSERRHGKVVKLGVVGKAEWEPIVDEDLWRGVVAMLKSRTRTPNAWVRKYLLSGLAVCGKCGKTLIVNVATWKKVPGYTCPKCFGVKRCVADVDAYVIDLIGARLAAADAKDLIRREEIDAEHAAEVQERIAALLKVRRLQSKMAIAGDITDVECEENIEEINAKIATLEAEVTEPRRAEVLEDAVNADDPRQYFTAAPLDRQRAIIHELVTITVLPGQKPRASFDEDLVVPTWKM